jgi:hypothetical protein
VTAIARCLRALAKATACGFLAAAVPMAIVLIYLFVELTFLDQPSDGNDSHLRGSASILSSFPLLWVAASVWFVLLGFVEKHSFRRSLMLTAIATLVLPIYLGYLISNAQAPALFVSVAVILGAVIGALGAALSSWGWVRLNATWPN